MREKIRQISREEESGEKTSVGVVSLVEAGNFTGTFVDDTSAENCCSQTAGSRGTTEKITDKGGFVRKTLAFLAPKAILITLVKLYQACVSPWFPPCCRFQPTCSCYAREALAVHGLFKGLLLSTWRILRCHPFCRGGYDPVPPQRVFGVIKFNRIRK